MKHGLPFWELTYGHWVYVLQKINNISGFHFYNFMENYIGASPVAPNALNVFNYAW